MYQSTPLPELVKIIIQNMEQQGFSTASIAVYRGGLNRLLRLAEDKDTDEYSDSLRNSFLSDALYLADGRMCDSRKNFIIGWIESYCHSSMMTIWIGVRILRAYA